MSGRRKAPIAELLMERTTMSPSGCWEWNKFRNRDGYGQFFVSAWREKLAHRVSYITFVGPIPDGLRVLHRCDNPSCIRPSHLFLGDQKANMADAVSKGRQARGARLLAARSHVLRGEEVGNHKLTEAQVEHIRAVIASNPPRGTQSDMARQYGVSTTLISRIKKSRAWKHA